MMIGRVAQWGTGAVALIFKFMVAEEGRKINMSWQKPRGSSEAERRPAGDTR